MLEAVQRRLDEAAAGHASATRERIGSALLFRVRPRSVAAFLSTAWLEFPLALLNAASSRVPGRRHGSGEPPCIQQRSPAVSATIDGALHRYLGSPWRGAAIYEEHHDTIAAE